MTPYDTALKLWVVLSRAQAAIAEHAAADVAQHGLSLAEFGALEALYHKGALLVGELQRKVLMSSGGITYLVDRLQEKGLVRRRPCKEDRRAIYAEITAEGEALMDRIFPMHAASVQKAVDGLTDSEQKRAIDLLRKLGHRAAERPLPGEEESAPEPAAVAAR